MNLEKEIKINKILLILLISLSVGTIALRTSHAMFSKKETFNNVLRIITGNELPGSGAEDLIKKAGQGGLQGINPETGELCISDCKEYRYTGLNVNNYVKLTNLNPYNLDQTQEELWRIIGVFQDEDNKEWFLRIVKDSVLSTSYIPENFVINEITFKIKYIHPEYDELVYFNAGGNKNNDWSQAGLQYYLNNEKDSGSNKGYMSYLSDETKSMLRDTKHYLGAFIKNTDTTVSGYQHERDVKNCVDNKGATSSFPKSGCNVWSGNAAIWEGSISLMYPSDYGYSANKQYWSSTKLSDYKNGAGATGWIMESMEDTNSKHSWLLSPSSTTKSFSTYLFYSGYILDQYVSDGDGSSSMIRPVLNIKTNVKIKKGTEGTKTNPYIFEI